MQNNGEITGLMDFFPEKSTLGSKATASEIISHIYYHLKDQEAYHRFRIHFPDEINFEELGSLLRESSLQLIPMNGIDFKHGLFAKVFTNQKII